MTLTRGQGPSEALKGQIKSMSKAASMPGDNGGSTGRAVQTTRPSRLSSKAHFGPLVPTDGSGAGRQDPSGA